MPKQEPETSLQKEVEPKGELTCAEGELLHPAKMGDVLQDVLSDIKTTQKEALDSFYVFKNLVENEGEGSSSTKEQMGVMLQIYLHAAEARLKALDLVVKTKKKSEPKPGSGPGTNININSGLSRREILKEIENLMGQGEEIEVINTPDSEAE